MEQRKTVVVSSSLHRFYKYMTKIVIMLFICIGKSSLCLVNARQGIWCKFLLDFLLKFGILKILAKFALRGFFTEIVVRTRFLFLRMFEVRRVSLTHEKK